MSRKCYGVLPMAGKGSRIQPIAFSKELYPVAYQQKHFAVSEFSVRAMLRAQVDEIKLVIRPEKMDIANYYATYNAPISIYMHTRPPYSLPESSFIPLSGVHDDDIVLFGLPDTLFSPASGYMEIRKKLEKGADICLGLFKVEDASQFDSVAFNDNKQVTGVLVKQTPPLSEWIWGIWGANGKTLRQLREVVNSQQPPEGKERLLGVGFNELAKSGKVNFQAVTLGSQYFDIGTMDAVLKIQEVIKDFEI